jgi:three-Cys-motif partner protein
VSEADEDFFAGKRPWSKIKDQVLNDNMIPYLAKVNSIGHRILLIDGYAGPGVFGDDTIGSPIIMCEAAEQYAKGNYRTIFINKDKNYHSKLLNELQRRGWSNSTEALLGDTQQLLKILPNTLKDQTVLLYLDPFGPTGCEFALLKPFLERSSRFSTEIILTMNMPAMHRLATPKAAKDGRLNAQMIRDFHQNMTRIFGGEYWKDIMWQDIDAEERELQLIKAYQDKLGDYLSFTGSCPVRERTDKRIKYFIVFASRHIDALNLLNDIMVKAYFGGMHKADFIGGLWEDTDWREMRSIDGLDKAIINLVEKYPGETRRSIWSRVVQEHFMRFLEPEYNANVHELIQKRKLTYTNPRGTKRLNEDCKLYLSKR